MTGQMGRFEYSSNRMDDAITAIRAINKSFEDEINDLKTSLSTILGLGTSGPIYDSFNEWFDSSIRPKLEAMLSKDDDILVTTTQNKNDYDDTTSHIMGSFGKKS